MAGDWLSCLEIDASAEPSVEVDLERGHLIADGGQGLLKRLDLPLDLGRRYAQHLLGLRLRDHEEGVANFVPVP